MATASALRRLSNFLFIGIVIWGFSEAGRAPVVVLVAAMFLFMTGVPLFVYALRTMERYKDVFDYEPTKFWGKTRNGKQAREALLLMTSLGLWSAVAAIPLFLAAISQVEGN